MTVVIGMILVAILIALRDVCVRLQKANDTLTQIERNTRLSNGWADK